MLEWIVFIVLFLVFYVVAAVADQRRPKKVKQEWRPSEEMYVVNDGFNVTHWLGTDVEIAKMYMEPGWKLGKGSPKGWKWETYETIYPYSSKYGGAVPAHCPDSCCKICSAIDHLPKSKKPNGSF